MLPGAIVLCPGTMDFFVVGCIFVAGCIVLWVMPLLIPLSPIVLLIDPAVCASAAPMPRNKVQAAVKIIRDIMNISCFWTTGTLRPTRYQPCRTHAPMPFRHGIDAWTLPDLARILGLGGKR
ncbi:MAG: hypothetical protein B7Z81_15655 [Acidocella sp. 20-61-6]|nr:MAG: hypothetical protein B7Z81_15655 [Acidocella sp. 20-61-6]